MSDPRGEIETLRERIEEGQREIESDADRERLIDFSDQLFLLREEYSDHRHLKLLRHLTRMAENVGGLNAALNDKDATEDIVRWIHATYDNEETNRDYRVALRIFGKRVAPDEDGDPPASIDWVSSKTPRNYDPAPDPADMLDWGEDVKPMIDAARNSRDAALMAVQFDAGLRGGELKDLTVGDVSDGEHGILLRVDGKTGQRSVGLIPSVPLLQRWLSDHPAPEDPDAPLWSKLSKAEAISYPRYLQCFKESAERAGVRKPVTPTNFRKSNATWLAKQGANAATIEDRQGRSRGSKAVSRYVARFGGDAEAQYARLHGKEVETEEDVERAPVTCPRCDKETPRDEDKCMWCGQVLDYEARREIEADQRDLRKAVFRFVKEHPDVASDVESAEDLMTIFDAKPELREDAAEFRKALEGE